jgi:hypothetical protein
VTQLLHGIASKLYQHMRPVRAPHYLSYLRTFPCVGCKSTRRQRDAMHTGKHGMGQKASDSDALPGCRQCHRELHQIGPRKFQTRHKIEFAALIEMFQGFYALEFPNRQLTPKIEGEAAA